MVRPTKFDKKYSLVRETKTKNDTGGFETSESVLYTDWCRKVPITGIKRMDFSSMQYTDPYTLTVRKRTDYPILNDDIIRMNGLDYVIKSIYTTEDEFYVIMDVAR